MKNYLGNFFISLSLYILMCGIFVVSMLFIFLGNFSMKVYDFGKNFFNDLSIIKIGLLITLLVLVFNFTNSLIIISTLALIYCVVKFYFHKNKIIKNGGNLFKINSLNNFDLKVLKANSYCLLVSLYFFNVFLSNTLNEFFSLIFAVLFIIFLNYSIFLFLASRDNNK